MVSFTKIGNFKTRKTTCEWVISPGFFLVRLEKNSRGTKTQEIANSSQKISFPAFLGAKIKQTLRKSSKFVKNQVLQEEKLPLS